MPEASTGATTPHVRLMSVRRFSSADLLTALRQTPLRGFDKALVYANADVVIAPAIDPETLAPAQRYVLTPTIERLIGLREALLQHGIDLLALNGGAWVRTEEHPDEEIPVVPPIVEESVERNGRSVLLINDGLHRVAAARALRLPISVVRVKGVSPEHPYYAYALENGWSEVEQLRELPDLYEKKSYRLPENYKALFREFNAVLPGVQKQRKQSNPTHLKA